MSRWRANLRNVVLLLAAGVSSGATARAPACALGSQSVRFDLPDVAKNFARGWHLNVSIGSGRTRSVQVDTGSIGFVVARSAIGPQAVGPLAAGRQEYTSNGLVLLGHYFRARVAFANGSAPASTVPMTVLGVERLACDSHYPKCSLRGRHVNSVGVLGVGFARRERVGENAFLRLEAMVNGRMSPGYIIGANAITLGLTAAQTTGFHFVQLAADGTGGWQGAPGCFGFPRMRGFEHMCGTMLVDTGLSSMIVSRAEALRPPGMPVAIPAGTQLSIASPGVSGGALAYSFLTGAASPLAPSTIRWSNATGDRAFVNTGRNVLRGYDYLYDAQCGRIGFRPR